MKLLEYEAKHILQQAGAAIPKAVLLKNENDATLVTTPAVIKSQVPTGGRGKAGGVKIVSTSAEVAPLVKELFELPIHGHMPTALLAEEQLVIARELYLSLSIDRSARCIVLLAHNEGGVDIESTTESASPPFRLTFFTEPQLADVKKLTDYFGLSDPLGQQCSQLISTLWQVFTQNDALLLEINPLIVTQDQRLVCGDAKIELDDAALFRHKEWQFEHTTHQNQFVVLEKHGNVACMANGAGLAMATVDAIKSAGAEPTNFLDIGGGTNTSGMVDAFKNIHDLPAVKAIVVNVFAGITRCDEVAQAIVSAKEQFSDLPPLCIRLAGTNALAGKQILVQHDITTLPSLQACVAEAIREVKNV